MIRKSMSLPIRADESFLPESSVSVGLRAETPTSRPRAFQASLVTERLYIGDVEDARDEAGLLAAGVTHVINLCPELIVPQFQRICYLPVSLQDRTHENLQPALQRAIPFITAALRDGGVVLVHCAAGISRSAAVVTAYLMMTLRENMTAALGRVCNARPIVAPNLGFLLALQSLEEERETISWDVEGCLSPACNGAISTRVEC